MGNNRTVFVFGMETEPQMNFLFFRIFKDIATAKRCGICGFVDHMRRERFLYGMPYYSVSELQEQDFSKIVILNTASFPRIKDELVYGYHVDTEKIDNEFYLLYLRILNKYQDDDAQEIQATLENMTQADRYDLWCGYCPEKEKLYEIQWDRETNMPYTFFCDKRMYFPREKTFTVEKGVQYVAGLEFEQQTGSPHTYITDEIHIKEGDVIVDAGVCEGNFSLKYVDIASKIYLIESDPLWRYPLELTFRDYLDKVVFCYKALSDRNDEDHITLDALVDGNRVDFIKMDIEGAELEALRGAVKTFESNSVSCSICSYHRHGDERGIKDFLACYGYCATNSCGHMIFPLDPEWPRWCELRHGIVYGYKLGKGEPSPGNLSYRECGDEILATLDEVSLCDDGFVYFRGWSITGDENIRRGDLVLVLQVETSDERFFYASRQLRPDVVQAFPEVADGEPGGFECFVHERYLKGASFTVSIGYKVDADVSMKKLKKLSYADLAGR